MTDTNTFADLPTYAPVDAVDLMTIGCGMDYARRINIAHPHFHTLTEIGMCLEGEGEFMIDGKNTPFRAGDCVIIFPHQAHAEQNRDATSVWTYIDVNLIGQLIRFGMPDPAHYEELLGRVTVSGLLNTPDTALAAAITRKLLTTRSRHYRAACLCSLIEELSEISVPGSTDHYRDSRQFERLEPMLVQMERDLYAPIPSVDELAAQSGMSVSTLRRIFLNVLGQTPLEYMQTLRVRRAQYLLLFTDSPVADIARTLGFQDTSGFNRVFRKYHGIPPRRYRTLYAGKNDPVRLEQGEELNWNLHPEKYLLTPEKIPAPDAPDAPDAEN